MTTTGCEVLNKLIIAALCKFLRQKHNKQVPDTKSSKNRALIYGSNPVYQGNGCFPLHGLLKACEFHHEGWFSFSVSVKTRQDVPGAMLYAAVIP